MCFSPPCCCYMCFHSFLCIVRQLALYQASEAEHRDGQVGAEMMMNTFLTQHGMVRGDSFLLWVRSPPSPHSHQQ